MAEFGGEEVSRDPDDVLGRPSWGPPPYPVERGAVDRFAGELHATNAVTANEIRTRPTHRPRLGPVHRRGMAGPPVVAEYRRLDQIEPRPSNPRTGTIQVYKTGPGVCQQAFGACQQAPPVVSVLSTC